MKRQPEPELMDSEEQTLAYANADFSDSNQLFVDLFNEKFADAGATGVMADLGCGPADICIRMSEYLPGWHLTGLDAGENMLKRAETAVERTGKQDCISLRLTHLPDTSLGQQAFDAVISNSLLHHLPDPSTLWDAVTQLARPGSPVLIMDLRRPANLDAAWQLVNQYAGDAPEVLREDFFNSLLAAYTPEEVRDQLKAAGLEQLEISLPSDRHWVVYGRVR